jgi:hypothetical protein
MKTHTHIQKVINIINSEPSIGVFTSTARSISYVNSNINGMKRSNRVHSANRD